MNKIIDFDTHVFFFERIFIFFSKKVIVFCDFLFKKRSRSFKKKDDYSPTVGQTGYINIFLDILYSGIIRENNYHDEFLKEIFVYLKVDINVFQLIDDNIHLVI